MSYEFASCLEPLPGPPLDNKEHKLEKSLYGLYMVCIGSV
jgi:hypothetical protein